MLLYKTKGGGYPVKKNITEFSKQERSIITGLYQDGYEPREIAELLDMPYYEVIFILDRLIYGS